MGDSGVLMQKEIYVYLGDTAPMFSVQAMFHVIHAGDVFPEAKKADMMRVKDVENGSYVNSANRGSV